MNRMLRYSAKLSDTDGTGIKLKLSEGAACALTDAETGHPHCECFGFMPSFSGNDYLSDSISLPFQLCLNRQIRRADQ